MKLSKNQQEIIDLMKDGWELGLYAMGGYYKFTLQKGGLGRGGEAKYPNVKTIWAIRDRKLIHSIGGWHPERFRLTEDHKDE